MTRTLSDIENILHLDTNLEVSDDGLCCMFKCCSASLSLVFLP